MEGFGIVFDRACYCPGDTVTGNVVLKIVKEISARHIKVLVHGAAHTKWDEVERRTRYVDGKSETYDKTKFYSAEIKFISKEKLLWYARIEESKIPPGRHFFPFFFPLPANCPPSIEGEYGHIRYYIQAELDRKWRFNQVDKSYFPVKSFLSKHVIGDYTVMKKDSKNIGTTSRKGVVTMNVKIPKTAYTPGEQLPITIFINNSSVRSATSLHATLEQHTDFYAGRNSVFTSTSDIHHRHRDKLKLVAECKKTINVLAQHTGHGQLIIKIPALPPTFQSPTIKNDYRLTVKLETETTFNNLLQCEFPIILGDVPSEELRRSRANSGASRSTPSAPMLRQRSESMPPSYSSVTPSAPSDDVAGPSGPPPSYEDSMNVTKV